MCAHTISGFFSSILWLSKFSRTQLKTSFFEGEDKIWQFEMSAFYFCVDVLCLRSLAIAVIWIISTSHCLFSADTLLLLYIVLFDSKLCSSCGKDWSKPGDSVNSEPLLCCNFFVYFDKSFKCKAKKKRQKSVINVVTKQHFSYLVMKNFNLIWQLSWHNSSAIECILCYWSINYFFFQCEKKV